MDENTKKFIEDTVKETVDDAVKTAAETQTPKKKKKISGLALYMLGSVVVTAGASFAVPKIMTMLSHRVDKAEKPVIDEDYEPVIVKREKKEEE